MKVDASMLNNKIGILRLSCQSCMRERRSSRVLYCFDDCAIQNATNYWLCDRMTICFDRITHKSSHHHTSPHQSHNHDHLSSYPALSSRDIAF